MRKLLDKIMLYFGYKRVIKITSGRHTYEFPKHGVSHIKVTMVGGGGGGSGISNKDKQ